MTTKSFIGTLFETKENTKTIASASLLRFSVSTPEQLKHPVQSKELEHWFIEEAKLRLKKMPQNLNATEKQHHLEMKNRYPDGSMKPISLDGLLKMSDFYSSIQDIKDRAIKGVALLKNNTTSEILGTAARGVPGGGASSRAAKWVRLNPETANRFGLTETTPRPLYRAGPKTLLQHTLDFSQLIARQINRVFPGIVMTNSENVAQVIQVVKNEFGNSTKDELDNTIFFNQIVLPRMWVSDQKLISDKLYPAGHGDYPYLLAKYKIVSALKKSGIKYLIFSNADEWLWQADPVMISIADELFKKGHHMIIIGTKNTNNQFGGGFVQKNDGTQSLVETPRLPYEMIKEGKAPVALNTTFYLIDVDYLAQHEDKLLAVEKSLVVKEVPGRQKSEIEQIIGVDSWAGDCFAAILNPAFIEWPRLNFLGIKDGSFLTGNTPIPELGNRTALHYTAESIATWPTLISDLIHEQKWAAEFLYRTGYCYL